MGTKKVERVYIAAASKDIDRATRCAAQLRAGGVEVTSRWLKEVKETGANPDDLQERIRRAKSDLNDLARSDLIWFIVPNGSGGMTTRGAWFELGFCHAIGTKLVSSGSRIDLKLSVFTALGDEFEDDVDALIRILRYAREGIITNPSVAYEMDLSPPLDTTKE